MDISHLQVVLHQHLLVHYITEEEEEDGEGEEGEGEEGGIMAQGCYYALPHPQLKQLVRGLATRSDEGARLGLY